MLLSRGNLFGGPPGGQGFRLALIVAGGLLLGCGDSSPPGAGSPAAGASPDRWTPPAGEAAASAKLAFYLDGLESGDPAREAWSRRQLLAAGPAAVAVLVPAVTKALNGDPGRAAALLTPFAEGLEGPLELLLSAARSPEGRVRLQAARALARHDGPGSVAALLDLAADGLAPVARAALAGIDRLASVAGARGLRGRFPDHLQSDPEILRIAVRVIGAHLPPEEAKAFLGGLLADPDPGVAVVAARALGTTAAAERLLTRFPEGAAPRWRLAVLDLLAGEQEPEAVRPLLRFALEGDLDSAVWATTALGRYRSGPGREALKSLLEANRPEVAREARHELLKAGDEQVLAGARKMLEGSRRERKSTALLLGSARAAPAVPALIAAAARESDPEVRLAMANALSLIGKPEGAPAAARVLLTATGDDAGSAWIAYNAARALLRFDELPPRALEIVGAAAKSESAPVRQNAARVLARFTRDPTVLAALLTDPEATVRVMAAERFGELPGAPLDPLLAALAKETDEDAARALQTAARMVYYRWQR